MAGNHECWDMVWNPVRGCTPVSEGCKNCTAARLAAHLSLQEKTYDGLVRWGDRLQPEWTGYVRENPNALMEPLVWSRPMNVLVGSMSDLFHPSVRDDFISDVFIAMMTNEPHTFNVVTKYALRMEQWFGSFSAWQVTEATDKCGREWPLPNVRIGISAEGQATLDERATYLVSVPAASKMVVLEPLISAVNLVEVECPVMNNQRCPLCGDGSSLGYGCTNGYYNLLREGIDWVVVGCETGPRSRTRVTKSEWVRTIRDQCEENNIPFFYKQARDAQGMRVSLPALDGRQWLEKPT
jgi:protein gp37